VKAQELLRAGQLDEAIASLGVDLRADPTDTQRRTFLFELLCFAGEHERAQKHLEVLSGGNRQAQLGALVYHSALHADRLRQEMFRSGSFPTGAAPAPGGGTLNGKRFKALADADPRIGARLEVFAAGQYLWIPFAHIASVRMEAPKRLRDLLWAPAIVRTGPGFEKLELGEVLIPALTPRSSQHPDPAVRLGRVTEWIELDDGTAVPAGQKVLLVDGEELPILELRELDITPLVPARR
jgi:type VI secretion system protein ImpE